MGTVPGLGWAGSVEGDLCCLVKTILLNGLWCGEVLQSAAMWTFVGSISDCGRLLLLGGLDGTGPTQGERKVLIQH